MRRLGIAALLAAFAVLAPSARAADFAAYDSLSAGDSGLRLTNYAVGAEPTRNRVFDLFTAAAFGAATERDAGLAHLVEGTQASLEIHQNPHSTLLLRTAVANQLAWTLPDDVGVVARGRVADVGNAAVAGSLILLGAGDLSKSGNGVTASLAAGEAAVFRASVGADGLAALIAAGDVVADVYVGDTADVVRYTTAAVTARRESSVAVVRVEGGSPGQMISITLPRSLADPAALAVDGSGRLREYRSVAELQASGLGFVVFSDFRVVEVLVLDDLSATTIRVGALGPSLEALLAVALAGATFAVAVFALRRRQ